MAAARKARCFVAMAFDHDDTDEMYEKSILPVLKSNDVIPIVINRRQDNRDINHQIIEQLHSCDFCIADLTYARPSVYFEAGYAQRAVDVIYTARADHLGENQTEDRRVHFDLRMKPIIAWKRPDDSKFRKELEKRLRATVLHELSRKWAAQDRAQKERGQFSDMSLEDRLSVLFQWELAEFSKLGYRNWYFLRHQRSYTRNYQLYETDFSEPGDGWWVSTWFRRRVLHVATIHVAASMTLTKLRDEFTPMFLTRGGAGPALRELEPKLKSAVRATAEHHFICSIADIPKSRISNGMPSLSWDQSMLTYVTTFEVNPFALDIAPKDGIVRNIFVHLIKGIQSFSEFETELTRITQKMPFNEKS